MKTKDGLRKNNPKKTKLQKLHKTELLEIQKQLRHQPKKGR